MSEFDNPNEEVLDTLAEIPPEKEWITEAIKGTAHFPQTSMGTLIFTLAKIMERDDWPEVLGRFHLYAPTPGQVDQLAHAMNVMHARSGIKSFTQAHLDGGNDQHSGSKVVDLQNVAAIWNEVVRALLPFLSQNIQGRLVHSRIKRNLLEAEGGAEEVRRLVKLIKEGLQDESLRPSLEEYKAILTKSDSGQKGREFAKSIISKIKQKYEASLDSLEVLTPEDALAIFDCFV